MSENEPLTQRWVAWTGSVVAAVLGAAFFVWQMRADIDRLETDVARELREQRSLLCDLPDLKDRHACKKVMTE